MSWSGSKSRDGSHLPNASRLLLMPSSLDSCSQVYRTTQSWL